MKKRFQKVLPLMCFLICLSANVFAQVTVQTKLDTSYMLIGDQMQLHVAVNSSSNLKSVNALIDQIDTSEMVEIIGETEWKNNGNTFLKSYTLTCFDSGYYNLMALPVAYQSDYKSDTAYSNTLGFMVDNPKIEEQPDSLQTNLPPAGIKGIIEEPTLLEDFYPLLIGLAVLLLLGVLAWYFFFRKEEEVIVEEPVIIRPAHEIALEKLGALKIESLWQSGDVKGYYTKLTFIFREYLENRYDIQALESTTEEVLQQLKKSDFDSEMNSDVTRVLQSADLVKFAKAKPASEFHEESFEKLGELIEKSKSETEGLVELKSNTTPAISNTSVADYQIREEVQSKQLATFPKRLIALLIDSVLIAYVSLLAVGAFRQIQLPFEILVPVLCLGVFFFLFYNFIWSVHKYGGSAGKLALGIRVRGNDEEFLSIGKAFLRQLVKSIISYSILFLGFVMFFFNKQKKTLHDYAAGSMVYQASRNFNPFFQGDSKFKFANFGKRLLANMIDGFIGNAVIILVFILSGYLPGFDSDGPLFAMIFLPILLVFLFLVFPFLVSKKGGTPGKLLVGIEVRDVNNLNYLSISKSLKRTFLKLFLSDLLLIGFFFFWENVLRQTLHDKSADSIVIEKNKTNLNELTLDS